MKSLADDARSFHPRICLVSRSFLTNRETIGKKEREQARKKGALRLPTEAGNRGENGRRTSALFRLVLWKITGTIRNCLCLTAFRWQNDETEMLSTWLARRCVLERTTLDREPRLRSRIFVSSRCLLHRIPFFFFSLWNKIGEVLKCS